MITALNQQINVPMTGMNVIATSGLELYMYLPSVIHMDDALTINGRNASGRNFGGQVRMSELTKVLEGLVDSEHIHIMKLDDDKIAKKRRDRKRRHSRKQGSA